MGGLKLYGEVNVFIYWANKWQRGNLTLHHWTNSLYELTKVISLSQWATNILWECVTRQVLGTQQIRKENKTDPGSIEIWVLNRWQKIKRWINFREKSILIMVDAMKQKLGPVKSSKRALDIVCKISPWIWFTLWEIKDGY